MDMSAIAGLAGSLKAATDITKAIVELRDAQLVQAKVIDLQREIMAAQGSALAALAERSSMMEEIGNLKAQIAERDAWEGEATRYQLIDHGGGRFTYQLRAGMENGEPAHRICAHCYQQRRKSILQSRGVINGRERVDCPACNTEFHLGEWRSPNVDRGRGRTGWTG